MSRPTGNARLRTPAKPSTLERQAGIARRIVIRLLEWLLILLGIGMLGIALVIFGIV
jgi:hypothetical protein